MVPNWSWCQIDSFTLLVPNWLRCQIGTGAKLTPFTPLVPNWFRCQIDSFYTLGAKLTLLHSWCQIGSGAKLTLLHSWCQIGPVPNWLRCQIDSGAKLVPVPNCPLILLNLVSTQTWFTFRFSISFPPVLCQTVALINLSVASNATPGTIIETKCGLAETEF